MAKGDELDFHHARMADAIAFVQTAMEGASNSEALNTLESTLADIMYAVVLVAHKLGAEPASPKRIEKLRTQLFDIRDALNACRRGTLQLRDELERDLDQETANGQG